MAAVPELQNTFQFSRLARKEQQICTTQVCSSFEDVVALLTDPKVQAVDKAYLPLFFPGLLDSSKPHAGQKPSSYCLVVGDYDGGFVGLAEAAAQLQALNIKALLIPTASWTETAPRWRVVVPLARRLQDGQDYLALVDRLNACLAGVLAPESWKRKSGWFYGTLVDSAPPPPIVIEGRCLDDAQEVIGRGLPETTVNVEVSSKVANELATFDVPPCNASLTLLGEATRAIKDADYPTWIEVTFALKAIEQHKLPIRAMWVAWTQGHSKFKPDDLKKWESLHPRYSHWNKVFQIARDQFSWTGGEAWDLTQDVQAFLELKGSEFENREWAKYTAPLNATGRNDMLLWRAKRSNKTIPALRRELNEAAIAYTKIKRKYGIASKALERLEYQEDVTQTAQQTAQIVDAIQPRLAGFELVNYGQKLCAIRCVEESDTKPTSDTAKPRKYQIREHSKSSLTAVLEQHIVFSAIAKTDGMEVPKPIPISILNHCLTGHDILVPVCNGIINHPIVLTDGRIISEHGYNPETKLYNTAPSVEYRACTDRNEATKWLAELQRMPILKDIAYATKHDEACGLAALLGQFNRKAFDKAPGNKWSAPTAQSGKTTAACAVVEVIEGFEAVTRGWPADNAEMVKTLLAIGRSGVPSTIFDNLGDGALFKSDGLDSFLTAPYWAARLLGENTDVVIPANTTINITGNNIEAGGALATRLLNINLDTQMVNPGQKKYPGIDLTKSRFEILIGCRPRVLQICVGILAWAATQEDSRKTANRYPMWNSSVGRAVWLLTGIDVSEVFNKQFEASTSNAEAQQLIEALLPLCESNRAQGLDPFISVSEMTDILNYKPVTVRTDNGRAGRLPAYTAEHLALLHACYEMEKSRSMGRDLHSKTVGARLSRNANVRVLVDGSEAILSMETRRGGNRWYCAQLIKR